MSSEKEILIKIKKIFKIVEESLQNSKYKKIQNYNDLFEWDSNQKDFYAINNNNFIKLKDLLHIEHQKKLVLENTEKFAKGFPANNILLWGARGTGKSSLVISIYQHIRKLYELSMLEIKNTQVNDLNQILRCLNNKKRKYIIFCDDFSFKTDGKDFNLFKNIIDGSARKNTNVLFYVTSNYRHIIKPTYYKNNDSLQQKEFVEDTIALSDRFGLWIGFNALSMPEFLDIVKMYTRIYKIKLEEKLIIKKALQWARLRGSNSAREAHNFVRHLVK